VLERPLVKNVSAQTTGNAVLVIALAWLLAACSGATAREAEWPPLATKWFERAKKSYSVADIEDAELAVENAARLLPEEPKIRILASQVALAQLEYDHCIDLLQGMSTTEARAIRGRALWYSGALEQTADELDLLLTDPEVRDPWAREIAKLARLGSGRKPFAITGGMLAVADMPKTGTAAMVVPLEVNGEPALGMIATGVPEAVIDSSGGARPSWISLRFGDSVEVRDVPALAKDLSGLSRQVNAPIKVLLGVNLLRHLNATFDFAGGQFVVRSFEPPPPPNATTLRLDYLRGGGMVIRSTMGSDEGAPTASLLIDTSLLYPIALDAGGWKKAGVRMKDLRPVEGMPGLKQGMLPMMHLGAFEVPQVPGVLDDSVATFEKTLSVDLDGTLGAGLLAYFRVTITADGRAMWLEDMPEGTMSAGSPDGAPPPESEAPVLPGPLPLPDGEPGLAPPAHDGLPGAPRLAPPQLTPPQP